ncbi:MAG: type II CAAX endopeptidase family protein [Candidatus Saccharimonadales bacterium]
MSTFSVSSSQISWGPLGALLITGIAVFGGQVIGLGVVVSFLLLTTTEPIQAVLARVETDITLLFSSYFIAQAVALGVVYSFVRWRKGSLAMLGLRRFEWRKALKLVVLSLLGFALTAGLVTVLLQMVAPTVDLTAQQDIGFLKADLGYELILAFMAVVVLAPFAEELIFRGLLLPALSKTIGLVPAVVIVSLGFGLLHPPLSAMVIIAVFALFLALIYVRTNSLWPAILLHSTKNLIAFIAIVTNLGVGL